MTALAGKTFGIVGALAAFPRRLAAREVGRLGGTLRRGVTRATTHVVFGRGLLSSVNEDTIGSRVEAETALGRACLSENGFLRILGLKPSVRGASLVRQSLAGQSGLPQQSLELLSLFDAFEADREPYSFRDLILAKKYADLMSHGVGWLAIARSVHRTGPVASLTALSLHASGNDAIHARLGDGLGELDGQLLLDLGEAQDRATDDWFEAAEEAEAEGRYGEAAEMYGRCLSAEPGDSIAAFNRANCLRASSRLDEASYAYMLALRIDPSFVEAWFNLAALARQQGRARTASAHLRRAIALDPSYADAIYNLASLEYELGELAEARLLWLRYLELDSTSPWAKTALQGVQYVDRVQRTAG